MDLGEKIKNLRIKNNISQEDLANGIGVSRQTISKWENNTVLPDSYNISSLCEFFKVNSNYFFNNVEEVTDKEVDNNSSKKVWIIQIAILVLGIGLLAYSIISIIIHHDYYNSMEFKASSGTSAARIPFEYFLIVVGTIIVLADLYSVIKYVNNNNKNK